MTNIQQEIWKDVKGFEGYYMVSNIGRVKSLERIVKRKNNSFSITENGSHFNSIQFINNVKKHEKATRVIIDNFIELSQQDFKDFQRGGL